MKQKNTFYLILALLAVFLLITPLWNMIQDLLTRIVMSIGLYKNLQDIIVPYEMKVVGGLIGLLDFPVRIGSSYFTFTDKKGIDQAVYLIWNCVGWQTLVFFIVTAIVGLSGRYKPASKLESFLIGLIGTYLINILRIFLVIIVYYMFGREVGVLFHDYFSGILTFSWLIFFWWFSYSYILDI